MSNIGRKIYGFCNGYFGRDDYEDKIILAEGERWILCTYLDKYAKNNDWVTVCNFDTAKEKQECIDNWSKDPYDVEE